jgi:predicted dehydrogenase
MFTSQTGMHLRYFSDIPSAARSDLAARQQANLATNLGAERASQDPRNAQGFALLTTLGCHDLSAMRDVLGMPQKCLFASRSDDPLPSGPPGGRGSFWWNMVFQYPGFKAYYEVSRRRMSLVRMPG